MSSAAALAQAGAASIPFRATTESGGEAQPWLIVIAVCAAALALAVFVLRNLMLRGALGRQASSRQISVVERTALNPSTQLVVVDYASRRLLLAVGSAGVICLRDDAQVDAAVEQKSPAQ